MLIVILKTKLKSVLMVHISKRLPR